MLVNGANKREHTSNLHFGILTHPSGPSPLVLVLLALQEEPVYGRGTVLGFFVTLCQTLHVCRWED